MKGKTLEPSLDVPSGKRITLKPLERESVISPSCPLTFTKSSLFTKIVLPSEHSLFIKGHDCISDLATKRPLTTEQSIMMSKLEI